MFQLAAVFSPGFEKVIPTVLQDFLPDAFDIDVSSGFARFCIEKKPFRAKNADFFNNVFLVLKEWNGGSKNRSDNSMGNHPPFAEGRNVDLRVPSFEFMAKKIKIPQNLIPEILKQNYKSFRLRFSKENVFAPVNKQVMANVESQISMQTGLRPDRLGGDTEFWFLTRAAGYACFALRMTKKQSTEKYLEKGELRPEFVTLLAAFAGLTKKRVSNAMFGKKNNSPNYPDDSGCEVEAVPLTILDPFAGHGGIVKRLSEIAPNAKITASEIDGELVEKLRHQNIASQKSKYTQQNETSPKSEATHQNGKYNSEYRLEEKLLENCPLENRFAVYQADATHLDFLAAKSVDIIITDPPWGFYAPTPKQISHQKTQVKNGKGNGNEKRKPANERDISGAARDLRDDKELRELYDGMLKEFHRIIKPNGTVCILTGAKEIFEAAFDDSVFAHETSAKNIRNDVLVNGKKSAVYVFH